MWMKIDDGLHAHRKTRAVARGHLTKTRDVAPMGLWVLAGSWAAQNGTDGWVPEDELDRFDDDWNRLADRLVKSGYWWPVERDGEPGYGFNDWLDYNPESEAASKSGSFGNHVRWHANKGVVNPECEHCPKEPGNPDEASDNPPDSGGDIGGRSGGESGSESRIVALPGPTRPEPEPDPTRPSGSDVPSVVAPPRDDADRICQHLADAIEANGSRRPPITARWRKEARLMLDKDKRTEEDVHRAIDWCQRDAFWKSNVMSVQKLRQQYDRLRLDAQHQNSIGPAGKQQATDDMFSRAANRMGVTQTLGAIE